MKRARGAPPAIATSLRACARCGLTFAQRLAACPTDGAPIEVCRTPPLVGRTIDKYAVEEWLGQGGMGVVYAGRHALTGREVALKVVHGDWAADPYFTGQLEREARAMGAVTHSHVVSVLDLGRSERGLVYLVMERIHGRSLGDEVRASGPLPGERLSTVGRAVSHGLLAIHHAGLLHRDLKPSNVLVGRRGQEPAICIADFGLATSAEAGPTASKLFGSLGYLAPERLEGKPATRSTDAYALGATLCATITGATPPVGRSSDWIRTELTRQRGDIARELIELTAALMDPDPDARATVADALTALDGNTNPPRAPAPPIEAVRAPPNPTLPVSAQMIAEAAAAPALLTTRPIPIASRPLEHEAPRMSVLAQWGALCGLLGLAVVAATSWIAARTEPVPVVLVPRSVPLAIRSAADTSSAAPPLGSLAPSPPPGPTGAAPVSRPTAVTAAPSPAARKVPGPRPTAAVTEPAAGAWIDVVVRTDQGSPVSDFETRIGDGSWSRTPRLWLTSATRVEARARGYVIRPRVLGPGDAGAPVVFLAE